MPHRLRGLQRPQVTFALRRTSLQDELVFKSLVRFLMDLLRQQWRYESSDVADVLVVGFEAAYDGFDASTDALNLRTHIRIGAPQAAPQRLMRPLRVSAVLLALNLAGDEVVRQRAGGVVPTEAVDPVLTLLRWPTLEILRLDPRFIRITAVLAAKPSTLANLVDKSGQALDVCERLIQALKTVGLVEVAGDQKNIEMKPLLLRDQANVALRRPVPQSLAATYELAEMQSRERTNAGASLWGRIRRRLGIATAPRNV